MAQPGWYPDPAGSGEPRYWDGRRWVAPGPPPRRRPPQAFGFVAGLLVLAVIVALLVWQPWRDGSPFGVPDDPNSARPSGSQWNELRPSETPTDPEDADDGGRPVECPLVDEPEGAPHGEWYRSGGMQFRAVPRWGDYGGWTIDFTSERSGQMDAVTDGWVAITAIGTLDTEVFSHDPASAARQLAECMSTSYYYRTLDHQELLEDRRITTHDGAEGWLLRINFWNIPDQPVVGDEVVVAVFRNGDDLILFHSQAPIDDKARKKLVADALASMEKVN
ncbi:MAG TPA: DUF2510 domain-containing protein [Arachnia sp.]|nr:DUF2510 domain-containing protein [Arachnia sp.]HMT87751.1 DUF2510 domain-containing protein [Arachnia sp.]